MYTAHTSSGILLIPTLYTYYHYMDHCTFTLVWTTINYAVIFQLLYIVKVPANELWNHCVVGVIVVGNNQLLYT